MQDEPKAELPGNAEQQTLEHVESEVKLSRRKAWRAIHAVSWSSRLQGSGGCSIIGTLDQP